MKKLYWTEGGNFKFNWDNITAYGYFNIEFVVLPVLLNSSSSNNNRFLNIIILYGPLLESI